MPGRQFALYLFAAAVLLCPALCFSRLDAPPVAYPSAPPVVMPNNTEVSTFLSRSDMIWNWTVESPDSLPSLWTEGPFVGNGMVGALLTVHSASPRGFTLQIEISRADYFDTRTPGSKYFLDDMYADTGRLPGGYFTLSLNMSTSTSDEVLVSGHARVQLAAALAVIVVKTNKGREIDLT